ncbi:MAG: hypothetical protein R6V85_17915 [Polyangia bacterium]
MRVTAILLASLATVLLAARPAGAQSSEVEPPDQLAKQEADEHFARGKQLFRQSRFLEAATEFQAAYEIAPHPAVLVNVAVSYDEAGKLAEAANHYRRYLKNPFEKLDNDEIRERYEELVGEFGRFRADCTAEGCVVWVGGVERGPAPVELFVSPGSHRVEAVVDGQVAVVSMQRVGRGETVDIQLEPKRSSRRVVLVKPDEFGKKSYNDAADRDGELGPGFWISASVTLAAGASTAVFGSLTLREADEFEKSGYTDADAKETGERDRLLTNILAGVTVAGAVASTVFAIVDLTGNEEPVAENEAETASRYRLDVSAAPLPGGLGLGLVGSF